MTTRHQPGVMPPDSRHTTQDSPSAGGSDTDAFDADDPHCPLSRFQPPPHWDLGISFSCPIIYTNYLTHTNTHNTSASLIDHFLVSTELVDSIENICVLDDGCNLSDHMPLVITGCAVAPALC